MEEKLYIPENDVITENGWFTIDELSFIIRKYKFDPDAIQFIAEMMEE